MFKINPKIIRFSAVLSTAVTTKVILIYLGYLGGNWLDGKWDTSPLFMFLGIVSAAGIGLWYVFFTLKRYSVK